MTISTEQYEVPLQAYDINEQSIIDIRSLFKPQVQPVVAIGCDLGKIHDYSAITVCSYEVRLKKPADWLDSRNPHPEFATHYNVSMCERIPIGTSYPRIADMICRIARKLYDRDQRQHLVCLLDQTGPGQAVVDLVRERVISSCLVNGVTITGGDKGDTNLLWKENSRISKVFLVSHLQAALQDQRLHMPKTPQTQELILELSNFEIRIKKDTGNLESGSFNLIHDDLAISLGLATIGEHAEPRLDHGLDHWAKDGSFL